MIKTILSFVFIIFTPIVANAQVRDGAPLDSAMIRFPDTSTGFMPDTSSWPLWQAGLTHKLFFATDSTGTTAMMTDTLHPYPAYANNWFGIKLAHVSNTIVDFWHKFQTNDNHAGGIVEFSIDRGVTWQNVKGDCNIDAGGPQGVLTTNFYSAMDTLQSGEPAFYGSEGGLIYSRFQFWNTAIPIERRSGDCELLADTFYVRFRFVSDSVHDTLAGWMIDSIKIQDDVYGDGAVASTHIPATLQVAPNPTFNNCFQFPVLEQMWIYKIEIYNAMGVKIRSMPYIPILVLADQPAGVYFYRVTGGEHILVGQLIME